MKRLFEKAFTPPFKHVKYSSWILDSNDVGCMQFKFQSAEGRENVLNSLNGIEYKFPYSELHVELGVVRHFNNEVIEIRGWGHLTGHGSLKLSDEEAIAIQDDLAQYVIEQLTRKS